MIKCLSCNSTSEYPVKDEGGFSICPVCGSGRIETIKEKKKRGK